MPITLRKLRGPPHGIEHGAVLGAPSETDWCAKTPRLANELAAACQNYKPADFAPII